MIARGRDLTRDPLNRVWDSVVTASPVHGDDADAAILRRFHALDAAPAPDDRFVERLAQQLTAFQQAQPPLQPALSAPVARKPAPAQPDSSHWRAPGHAWRYALAAALAMLIGGVLVIWLSNTRNDEGEAVIPAVVIEATPDGDGTAANLLLSTTFDPADLGATGQAEWTVSMEYQLDIPTGETYRQNGPESGDNGISVVVITTGTFDALSTGPTLLYRKGDPTGQDVAPNTHLSLSVGDSWIASMHDLVTAANTSGAPAEILRYAVGKPGDQIGFYFEFTPGGGYPFAHDPEGPSWPEGPVSIELRRVPLATGESYGVEIRPDESFLLLTSGTGAVRVTKDGSNRGASATATSLGDYPAGAYTIKRDLPGNVDVYLARWTSAAAASPAESAAADMPAMETLLDVSLDPAALDAGAEAGWNYSGVFPKTGLHPGQSIALDATNWGAGLTVTQVLEGALTLDAQGPIQVVRAGEDLQEMFPAGSSIVLDTGDAVFLDASHGAELRNDSDADVSLLTFVAFDVPDQFFPDIAYPENIWGPLSPLVDLDLSQRFDGPVTVSFEQVALNQQQSIDVDVGENELVFYWTADGSALEFLQQGSSQSIPSSKTALHDKGPGAYTLTRLARDPIEVTIVRMRPAGAVSQEVVLRDMLANLTFDPALLGSDATQSWNMIQDFVVDVGPGETMSIGGEQFDGGFFATFPLRGSVEVSSSRDALWSDHFGAGVQPIGPGDTEEIFPGQVWVGAAATPIEIANRTDQNATLFVHSLGSTVSNARGGDAVGSDRPSFAKIEAQDPGNNLVYGGEPVTVSVERLTLGHAQEYEIALATNETVLLATDDGSPVRITSNQNQIDTASNQRVLHGTATPQTYTITRDLQDPVDVYLIRVSAPPGNDGGAPSDR